MDSSAPGYPQITRHDNEIRILLWSASYDDPVLCVFGVGTATFSIGTYAAGTYSVEVDRFDHLLLSGEPAAETLGTVPFTVAGGAMPPASAPTLNALGSSLLLFMLVALAARSLRKTRAATPLSRPLLCARNRRRSDTTGPN